MRNITIFPIYRFLGGHRNKEPLISVDHLNIMNHELIVDRDTGNPLQLP